MSGNGTKRPSDIALLAIAVFLTAIYFLKEFYLSKEPAQTPPISASEQTIFEVEDSSGNSKVYTYPQDANIPLPKGTIKNGTKVKINKDGSAQVGLMSGEKRLIFSILLDINRATAQDFEALPGIGPKLAEEIIATRKRLGGFKTSGDIKKVKGIGDKKFEKIRGRLTVNSATPSPPPSSSAAFQ